MSELNTALPPAKRPLPADVEQPPPNTTTRTEDVLNGGGSAIATATATTATANTATATAAATATATASPVPAATAAAPTHVEVVGTILNWDDSWGGYISSPSVHSTILALVAQSPGITSAHVGRQVRVAVVRIASTGALVSANTNLLMANPAADNSHSISQFDVTITLSAETQEWACDCFPELPPSAVAGRAMVRVGPGQTVQEVTEAACRAFEDCAEAHISKPRVPGFEPLSLTVTDGASMPLRFEDEFISVVGPGAALTLDGEFIDLSAIGNVDEEEGMERVPEKDKMPVTIITGFLGAGKTTFLKYLLTEQKDKKYAVIENEFGAESIDSIILGDNTKMQFAEKMITMDNGCMCCTVRGDIIDALLEVWKAKEGGAAFNGVFIETTGLADPAPIIKTFMECQDVRVKNTMRLDGIVTLVDAKRIETRLDDRLADERVATEATGAAAAVGKNAEPKPNRHVAVNEARQQVAFADRIILNKIDLVDQTTLHRVLRRLREINRFARVVPANMGRVNLDLVQGMRTLDLTKFIEADSGLGEQHEHEEKKKDHSHGDHTHGDHTHDHSHNPAHGEEGHVHTEKCNSHDDARGTAALASSFALERKGTVPNQNSLYRFLRVVASSERQGLATRMFRCKGVVAMKGLPFKRVFQMVGESFDQDHVGEWAEDEERICKVVFIGVDLKRKEYENLMDQLVNHSDLPEEDHWE